MRKLLLLITCLAACGAPKSSPGGGNVTMTRGLGGGGSDGAPSGAAPSCEAAGEHVASLADITKKPITDDQRRMGALAFRERCTEDKWPASVQTCLIEAKSRTDVSACRKQLTPDQNAALRKDLNERLGRTHTGDQPKAVNMSADPCEGGE